MKRFLILLAVICSGALTVQAAEEQIERVSRLNRVDREINNRTYVYKGEWITGLTASYVTVSTDNSDALLFLDNIDASFGMTSIKPYVGYLYRNNQTAGLKFGYSFVKGTVESARLDFGEVSGIQIDIPYINTSGRYYTAALFHRSYVPLDRKGHFGVFAELELGTTTGHSIFEYGEGSDYIYTKSNKTTLDLNFNPGVSAFVTHNVSATMSFGFGGINYTNIRQYDENGAETGERDKSSMSFKFNFLAVNFGITFHIWKKQ